MQEQTRVRTPRTGPLRPVTELAVDIIKAMAHDKTAGSRYRSFIPLNRRPNSSSGPATALFRASRFVEKIIAQRDGRIMRTDFLPGAWISNPGHVAYIVSGQFVQLGGPEPIATVEQLRERVHELIILHEGHVISAIEDLRIWMIAETLGAQCDSEVHMHHIKTFWYLHRCVDAVVEDFRTAFETGYSGFPIKSGQN
jgi:hypothetical protein